MIVEMLIAQMCVGLAGQEHSACVNAAEAAAIHYHVKQDVGTAERATADLVQRKVESVTGKEVAAIGLFTAKAIRDKEVSARLTKGGDGMPSINATAGKEKGSLTFGWSF